MDKTLVNPPYADARNAVALAVTLWIAGVGFAAQAGAFERIGGSVLAALFVFTGGIGIAAATLDRRIAAWVGSWLAVRRVAQTLVARPLAAAFALGLPAAFAAGSTALEAGMPVPAAAILLAGMPPVAGLASALLLEWARARRPAVLAGPARGLASTRATR